MDEGYELVIDVPGFKKEEVKAALKDGYLTVSAAKGLDEEQDDKKTDVTSEVNVMQEHAREAFM